MSSSSPSIDGSHSDLVDVGGITHSTPLLESVETHGHTVDPTLDAASAQVKDTTEKTREAWYKNAKLLSGIAIVAGAAIAFTATAVAIGVLAAVPMGWPAVAVIVGLLALLVFAGVAATMGGTGALLCSFAPPEKPKEENNPSSNDIPTTSVTPASTSNDAHDKIIDAQRRQSQ